MGSPEFEALLARADRTQKILWAVLTLTIVVYAIVAHVTGLAAPAAADDSPADALRPIFWVISAALAATSVLLSRRRARPAVVPAHFADAPSQPSPAMAVLGGSGENLPPHERRALAAVARGFTTWIACLVMNEAIAILGLVLAFMAGAGEEILPFAGLAILLNLTMRPDARRRAADSLGHVGL